MSCFIQIVICYEAETPPNHPFLTAFVLRPNRRIKASPPSPSIGQWALAIPSEGVRQR